MQETLFNIRTKIFDNTFHIYLFIEILRVFDTSNLRNMLCSWRTSEYKHPTTLQETYFNIRIKIFDNTFHIYLLKSWGCGIQATLEICCAAEGFQLCKKHILTSNLRYMLCSWRISEYKHPKTLQETSELRFLTRLIFNYWNIENVGFKQSCIYGWRISNNKHPATLQEIHFNVSMFNIVRVRV